MKLLPPPGFGATRMLGTVKERIVMKTGNWKPVAVELDLAMLQIEATAAPPRASVLLLLLFVWVSLLPQGKEKKEKRKKRGP